MPKDKTAISQTELGPSNGEFQTYLKLFEKQRLISNVGFITKLKIYVFFFKCALILPKKIP